MILGTKARYAVMAMVELACRKPGTPVSLSELAAAQEITVPYLEQIFAKLRKNGLVSSVRGSGGGYILSKKPDDILILDIMNAVGESTKITRCNKKEAGGCMSASVRCTSHDLWLGLENYMHQYLRSVTLDDVKHSRIMPDAIVPSLESANWLKA